MGSKTTTALLILGAYLIIVPIFCAPADGDQALVVSSTVPPQATEIKNEEKSAETTATVPQISKMYIRSDIRNRFAHTTITSRVKNAADRSQEALFSVILPETAFISAFSMEVDGKNYTAYVKEKEEAKRVYDEAVASGVAAAHVAVSARDSNRFTVSVHIEPKAKAVFYLTYEQLLNRQQGYYEQVINIHPGQLVPELNVEVAIAESRKITFVKTPSLRTGNDVGLETAELDPEAVIEMFNDTAALVKFNPTIERQKQLGLAFATKEDLGFFGQFVVQYDVERDPNGGEVLIQDGYFVHFFAPSELKPLPKQVVFVLDTSGSMWGLKLAQLKEAMLGILDQLNEQDSFNLVDFNNNARVWDLNNLEESVWYPHSNHFYYGVGVEENATTLENATFPKAYPVNADNIMKAKDAVSRLISDGSTGMYGALQVGLRLVELERSQPRENNTVTRQPLIIFLTDGKPTDLSTEEITSKVTEFNSELRKAPIFALSFGDGADRKFLQTLSLRNSGFSKHIYEAADAVLQLDNFYRQVSSPLLSGVTFKYEPSVTSLTTTEFPIYFGGSEIVVAGFCGSHTPDPVIESVGVHGSILFKPVVTRAISSTERLWAYLTIGQLLENKETVKNKTHDLRKNALELALKYSFVTQVTSLVVVKPNDTSAVDTQEATRGSGQESLLVNFASYHNSLYNKDTYQASFSMSTTPRMFPKSKLKSLLFSLPWLKDILTDGLVKVQKGTYKLGLNESISDMVSCPKTPLNQEGHCTLLHDCSQVHLMLKTSTDFFDHFCVLKNEYAGICCPNQ